MTHINNFAFFWVGSDISIPSALTKSILHAYKEKVNIFMLTDKKTPYIQGAKAIRSLLPKDIMLARLKAYSKLKIDEPVIFLDADSMVLNKFPKIQSNKSLIIFRRKKEGLVIKSKYPEMYPEFYKKTFDEMMPFLFGAIVTTNKNSFRNFILMFEILKDLPERFHRWYGDQYALKIITDKNLIDYDEKEFSEYIDIISEEKDLADIKKSIVTFKGPESKKLISNFLIKLDIY